MDKKLKSILDRVLKLSKQNVEFDHALRKALEESSPAIPIKSENKDISNIEKYLGLDYYVDSKDSIINYSFIKEKEIRDQLESDNREMMRYRYGTRSHKIDFPEFCRYAHMQTEMLLNFYYETVNNKDLGKVKTHILRYNETAKLESYKNIQSISFNCKWWAFQKEFALISIGDDISHISKVRNEQSHRSPNDIFDQLLINKYQNKLEELRTKGKIPLQENGLIDWPTISKEKNNEIKDTYKKDSHKIEKLPEYIEYKYSIWYKSEPFDSIINSIKILTSKVQKSIDLFYQNQAQISKTNKT